MQSPRIITLLLSFLVVTGCSAGLAEPEDKDVLIEDYTSTVRDGKEVIDPVHGKEIGLMYGAISGINKTNANGVAYIHAYEDGFYVAKLNLNILFAPEGKTYVGYLFDEESTKTVKLGDLSSIIGDVRHSLRFETKQDLRSFNRFVVKLSDQIVAEGTIKDAAEPIR